jgi:hypothetical protein
MNYLSKYQMAKVIKRTTPYKLYTKGTIGKNAFKSSQCNESLTPALYSYLEQLLTYDT